MNSRIWITAAAVAAAVALGSSLAVWDEEQILPAPAVQPQSGVAVEEKSLASSGSSASSSGYWMRNWQGRLGVFVGESEEPEMVFDVYIKNLPEADRTLLAEGLYVAEYADLVSRIEDYIS